MSTEDRTLLAPVIVYLADVEPEAVCWIWPGRLPRGKTVMLDGDPGLGKSTLALDLAARVSTGRPMPGETTRQEPAGVVVLSAEDGAADTIRPRLDAAGGDARRVVTVDAVRSELSGEEASVCLPGHVAALADAITQVGATLVIVDPLMAYLAGDTNSKIDHDVRRSLAPLARLAEESGACIVFVRHLNKSTTGTALYRGGGSIAFIGAARVGLLVARDPDDEGRRVLAVTKCNLAPEAPSLSFGLEGAPNGAARVVWGEVSPHRADALVAQASPNDGERSELDEAMGFLMDVLRDGTQTVRQVSAGARAAGIAERTLSRARRALGVQARRTGGVAEGGAWVLTLPTNRANGSLSKSAERLGLPAKGAMAALGGRDRHDPAPPTCPTGHPLDPSGICATCSPADWLAQLDRECRASTGGPS